MSRGSASIVRIGCGAGFWGDSPAGAAQLVRSDAIDVLMLDYLAEITMAILARARAKDSKLGYATDFVSLIMAPLARDIATRGIKVITNAGGMNPASCRDAVEGVLAACGVHLTVAVIEGDDITFELDELRRLGIRDIDANGALPAETLSANVYLGAFPIADALCRGADIVITGRCADSALALGPLIAAFNWLPTDLDVLALGSLAGHIIECGTQATGGLFTDWREVVDGWDDVGFPIVECAANGEFVVTKPPRTAGVVTSATVAEQIVYEIHDPAAYVLPDVVCDFTHIEVTDLTDQHVRVTGARGHPATGSYKASLTFQDGYRCTATLLIVGQDAVSRSKRVADAILTRSRRFFSEQRLGDYRDTSVEVLGSEAMYGAHSKAASSREVILKIAVAHGNPAALEIFAREVIPAATSMAQGTSGFAAGRPKVQPRVRLVSCLVPKERVTITVDVARERQVWNPINVAMTESYGPSGSAVGRCQARNETPAAMAQGTTVDVPLLVLARGRSGDKGDTANIGVLARRPEFLPMIGFALTAAAVGQYLGHLIEGDVERYDWPGLHGYNFVLHRALGGGGAASLRHDPQGKSYAQILMDFPISVPATWCDAGGVLT